MMCTMKCIELHVANVFGSTGVRMYTVELANMFEVRDEDVHS